MLGWGNDQEVVRVEGSIGASDVQKTRWPAAYTRGQYIDALTTAGPEALVVETRYNRGPLEHVIPWRWTWAFLLLQPSNQVSRYATLGEQGRRDFGESRLGVDCLTDVLDAGLACAVFDGTRTRILKIDARTGNVEGIGWLDGHFVNDQHVVRGWLTGWAASRPVAIRLSTREVLYLPRSTGAVSVLSIAGDRLYAINRGQISIFSFSAK